MEWGAGGVSFKKPSKGSHKSRNQILFQNLSNVPRSVTIGSFHVDGEHPCLQPFIIVEDVKCGNDLFLVSHSLILQATSHMGWTNYDRVFACETPAQTAKPIQRPTPRCTPSVSQEGIPVGTLERKTTWEVHERGDEIYLKVRKERKRISRQLLFVHMLHAPPYWTFHVLDTCMALRLVGFQNCFYIYMYTR